MADFGYIALFLLVSLGFAGLMLTLPVLLRWLKIVPYNPNAVKSSTFECGLITIGRSWVQFNPRYYFFALMMVALDVTAIFIYSWAVILRQIGAQALLAALVLITIVSVGYLFAWRKGVLEWK
jgi:NADH-quinone oxidoreductase subunit A